MVPVEEKGNVWTLHGHFVPFSGGANGKWSGEVVWMVQPEDLASLFFVISGLGKKPWHRQFHPAFSPLSWEPCGASCGGVVSVRLP